MMTLDGCVLLKATIKWSVGCNFNFGAGVDAHSQTQGVPFTLNECKHDCGASCTLQMEREECARCTKSTGALYLLVSARNREVASGICTRVATL